MLLKYHLDVNKSESMFKFIPTSGGDQVVSVLAIDSDDPSLNPAEVYSFYSVYCLKRTKINKYRPGMAHFFKKVHTYLKNEVRRNQAFTFYTKSPDQVIFSWRIELVL